MDSRASCTSQKHSQTRQRSCLLPRYKANGMQRQRPGNDRPPVPPRNRNSSSGNRPRWPSRGHRHLVNRVSKSRPFRDGHCAHQGVSMKLDNSDSQRRDNQLKRMEWNDIILQHRWRLRLTESQTERNLEATEPRVVSRTGSPCACDHDGVRQIKIPG